MLTFVEHTEEPLGREEEHAHSALGTLTRGVLSCTSPLPSRDGKSDLDLWREIFTLFEDGLIFCSTRECSALNNIDDIITCHESFWSRLETNKYVCRTPFI